MDTSRKPTPIRDLAILEEIDAAYASITTDQIRRVAARLGEARSGERTLGAVHNEDAQRLWALADYYDRASTEAALRAKFDAASEDEATDYAHQSARATGFKQVARQLFWQAVKCDIGGSSWTADEIGLRAGWMLVTSNSKRQALSKLISGIQLPPGLFPPPESGDEEA